MTSHEQTFECHRTAIVPVPVLRMRSRRSVSVATLLGKGFLSRLRRAASTRAPYQNSPHSIRDRACAITCYISSQRRRFEALDVGNGLELKVATVVRQSRLDLRLVYKARGDDPA
ncbi:hypothetical protein EVAR_38142_1 [Eumeta japonica]|uniref:Uncharacterized protein n=1 Tax=Eumeta variegata TaxID=151549 RepID=A0A4C1YR03_EUMVA|nr:hypothetical protein EVAR_38142_1 [Eumeta japonica]